MGKLHAEIISLVIIINNISQPTAEKSQQQHNTEQKIVFSIKKFSEATINAGDAQVLHHDLLCSFLACEQALEPSTVTTIDGNFAGNEGNRRTAVSGKVRGFYVTSSEGDGRHLVAIEASFADDDRLIFFGVIEESIMESHISVIGGSGRFHGANGFAIVNSVGSEMRGTEKKHLFNVYLKWDK